MRMDLIMEMDDQITVIKGVGEKTALSFGKLGIRTVGDLLEYYPRGYDVYDDLIPAASVAEGQTAAIEASPVSCPRMKQVRNLKILSCRLRDGSGSIMAAWFNMPFLKNTLKMGTKYIFRGKVVRKNGILVMEQPAILSRQDFYNRLHVLQPVYPLTSGVTNNSIVKAVGTALKETGLNGDFLPLEIRKEYGLADYKTAVRQIHFPKDTRSMLSARRRIVFDEFFLFTLAVSQLKRQRAGKENLHIMKECRECREFMERLPYRLTDAQLKVWNEIKADMTGGHMMNRLIQGDVGSGKTVLAALALLMTALNGYQGTIMVPTEVLAGQHYETLSGLLEPFGVKTQLLTGSMTAREKREACKQIKNHQVHVIVGTHALIQERVEYDNLALVITDEQHRFGVRQREALSEKGTGPHILVMSATPIPRTLAIILYGDLDISIIDELPIDRLPIKNCVVNTSYRPNAYRFIEKEVLAGHQAYIICPMVEESEAIEAENVIDYTEQLRESLSADIAVEYLHGRMKPREKNEIMERFFRGDIQVLVSTTVVEVGVNVPNATVIMIENAERFGLAQLHQLRGRVGRGQYQSYCILVSGSQGKDTMERLEILNHSNDGFYIAGEDLKLRGPGDLFGIRQSGMLEFKMADVFQDAEVLKDANEAAQRFADNDVKLLLKKYKNLHEKISIYTNDLIFL